MITLFNNGKIALVADGNEYRIGKPTEDNDGKFVLQGQKYYYRIEEAVRKLAENVSNTETADLWAWLACFAEVCDTVKNGLKEGISE